SPDMTLAVDCDVKQQNNQLTDLLSCFLILFIFCFVLLFFSQSTTPLHTCQKVLSTGLWLYL
ncbi:MAG: hypothetical protein AB2693_30545, partial [Candidatus Thiodiazotropha sp.]